MKYVNKQTNKAFTLIELSIVVVIIGLIVAGVVAGQSLVRQAKLRTIISDADQIKVAMNAFRLQYNQLPGDILNASSYWSGTNNGNNDGIINLLNNTAGAGYSESSRVFEHLALAGLLSGSYEPTTTQGYPSSIEQGVFIVSNYTYKGGYSSVSRNYLGGTTVNIIRFGDVDAGRYMAGINTHTYGPQYIVLVAEAVNIDNKIDDGKARHGSFTGHNVYFTVSGIAEECLVFPVGTTAQQADGRDGTYNIGTNFGCNLSFNY